MHEEITKPFLDAISKARESANLSTSDLERELVLGPGWLESIESGEMPVDLGMYVFLARRLDVNLQNLLNLVPKNIESTELPRLVHGKESGKNLEIHFDYAGQPARYLLEDAALADFSKVLLTLRDGLALASFGATDIEGVGASKTKAVVDTFQLATRTWPKANPSDLWWFLVYRAFLDPYNHPASSAKGNLAQSWIRTSGWALEKIFVDNYSAPLRQHGLEISIEQQPAKSALLSEMKVDGNLNHDKVDIILSGNRDGKRTAFGVVHVKASFAERRTDDVPMSQMLIRSGYFSPLLTLDCKSMPSELPVNRGELGTSEGERSDKRLDIERDGVFSDCFSFNLKSSPTTDTQAIAKIHNCIFDSSEDAFVKAAVAFWNRFTA
jgi:transcriptional regulator with XRE-family HTH domain